MGLSRREVEVTGDSPVDASAKEGSKPRGVALFLHRRGPVLPAADGPRARMVALRSACRPRPTCSRRPWRFGGLQNALPPL